MVPLVEDNIMSILLRKLCVMFDEWKYNKIHYVAMFCTNVHDETCFETLIAWAPLLEEGDLSSDQHTSFLIDSLSVYGKSLEHLACIIGDNGSVNQCLAKLKTNPPIGCYSHKFNFAVEHLI